MDVPARTRASTAAAEMTADGSASAEIVTLPTIPFDQIYSM